MQALHFEKYQGTGNDFIMIDDRHTTFDIDNHALVKRLCDRKFGIGADGLILLRNHPEADFEMVYFNADGYQTSLCGNGSRCAVQYAKTLGIVDTTCTFQTIEGLLKAHVEQDEIIINMPEVSMLQVLEEDYFLDTGSPHYVRFVKDVDTYDVVGEGKKIRYSAPYVNNGGVNVNFVEARHDNGIFVRTYERGVEDETLSCGTGVTAAAITFGHIHKVNHVQIQTPGGQLSVKFKPDGNAYREVLLKGPAQKVFEGVVRMP